MMEPTAASAPIIDGLAELWQSCREGASATRIIVGAAGIGKTTVLTAVADAVGDAVTAVRCQGGALAAPGSTVATLMNALGAAEPIASSDPLELADALDRALLVAAQRGPVAVVIDDLHDVDPASGVALGLAARRARAAGVLLLAAARPTHDILRLTEGLPIVELGPLDAASARALLDAASEHRVDDAVAERLLERAHGFPLALAHLPRQLTAEQLAGTAPLPDTFALEGDARAVFSGMLAALSPAARAIIEAAAVAESGDWAAICRCVDVPIDEALSDLERSGVATVDQGRLKPTHPLLLDAAALSLDPSQRRQLDLCFANDERLPATTRLIHRARAAVEPDPSLATRLAEAAAGVLSDGGGEIAGRLWDAAVEHAPGPMERWQYLLAAAEAYGLSGDPAAARARLTTVVDEAPLDPIGITASVPLAAMESLSGAPRQGVQRLAECAALTPPELAIPIALARPIPLGMIGDVAAIVDATTGVVDALPPGTDVRDAAAVIHAHGLFAVDEKAATELLPDEISPAMLASGLELDPSFGLHVGRALGYAERYEVAEHALLGVIAGARAARARSTLAMAFGALADVRLRSCRFDDARTALDEAISISLGIGQRAFAPFWLGMRARIDAIRGDDGDDDLALAQSIADDLGLEGARYYTWAHAGSAALAANDPVAAIAVLERCRQFEANFGHLSPQVARWRLDLVDAYVRRGDAASARAIIREVENADRPLITRWSRAAIEGMHGLVASIDDTEAAEHHVDAAIATFDATVDRFETARMHAARSRIAARKGDLPLARRHRQFAQDGFAALGAARWSAQLSSPSEPASASDDRLAALTPAERRIVDLVARGLTNQQVASTLNLSTRTVANHLYRAYMKLGVASRTEAALVVAGRRPA